MVIILSTIADWYKTENLDPGIEWEGLTFLFNWQTDSFHAWPSACARLLFSYTFPPTEACQQIVQANHLYTPITQQPVCVCL